MHRNRSAGEIRENHPFPLHVIDNAPAEDIMVDNGPSLMVQPEFEDVV